MGTGPDGGGQDKGRYKHRPSSLSRLHHLMPLQLSNQIQTRTQRTIAGLPSSRTDLDSAVFMDEDSCLKLAEELLHVATDVIGVHFVRGELPVGIEDEAAPQGDALSIEVYAELLRQGSTGIRQKRP